MQAINFTLSESYNALQARNTVCTIRYGDIADRYREGQIINITFGDAYTKKINVFTAYIDKVLVKPIKLLTGRELNGENHKLNTKEEFLAWYRSTFKKTMNWSDVVTVIYFSEIIG